MPKEKVTVRYVARSDNRKTGNIPSQWIGKDIAQSRETCQGCPLLEKICYSQNGTVANFGFAGLMRGVKNNKDYSLDAAIKGKHKDAKFFRFGTIGDPSAISKIQYDSDTKKIREAGFGILSYTHFWNSRGKHLKRKALASCDTWEEVELSVDSGWRATVHVSDLDKPQGKTESGKTFTLCPAQRGYEYLGRKQNRTTNKHYNEKYKDITCNDCGLCDPQRKGLDVVVFLNH